MNSDKWNEICFLLSENIHKEISESQFELNVIQALRVLEWKEYLGDFHVRKSIPIGASNNMVPDFIIKKDNGKALFVIEIKQPNIPITSRIQQQLFSYMRQLKLEYGILLGQVIQVFYDGNLTKQDDPVLLDTINIERDNGKGQRFVELFSKDKFNSESLKEYTLESIKKIDLKKDFRTLTNIILSESYQENIFNLIKQDFISDYDGELIDDVLNELEIKIRSKEEKINYTTIGESRQIVQPQEHIYNSIILPIELNPQDDVAFKRKLLVTKKAYITTFYANGTQYKKVWNASNFKETSGVIGNLRSRPEFRSGNWQKRGIIKVFVSIEE